MFVTAILWLYKLGGLNTPWFISKSLGVFHIAQTGLIAKPSALQPLDKIRITSEEQSVYEKFKEEIEFNDGMYVVKLPTKEYRQTDRQFLRTRICQKDD